MRVIALLVVIAAQTSFAAGFDCSKASSEVERLICSERSLKELDSQLNNAYRIAIHNTEAREPLLSSQRLWLSGERNKCKTKECLLSAYESRIKNLKDSAILGAIDKEISFEEVYSILNLRSFYSSFGPRLQCVRASYLSEFFDRDSITNKGEWWYLDQGNDFWSISITGKNNISMANTIKSGTYRASSEVFVVYDNELKEWRSIEASISPDDDCVKKYSASPN